MTEILMATHNGEQFLREQIDSILAQTEDGWHLSVSDDGSTDGTVWILEDYASRMKEKITVLQSGKTFGSAKNHFLWLIGNCNAEWMMLCDQDDTWAPEKAAIFREAIDEAETAYGADTPMLIFCDQAVTNAAGNMISPSLMKYQKQYTDVFDYRRRNGTEQSPAGTCSGMRRFFRGNYARLVDGGGGGPVRADHLY